MDSGCYLRNCSLLTGMAPAVKNLCQVPATVKEDLDGCAFCGASPDTMPSYPFADVVACCRAGRAAGRTKGHVTCDLLVGRDWGRKSLVRRDRVSNSMGELSICRAKGAIKSAMGDD